MVIGRVLGPTEVEAGGARVDLGGPLPRRLVTALLAAEGRPVGEEALAETIWGGSLPASFSTSLQAYVSRLRRAFGGEREALERVGDGYRLRAASIDAAWFADGVAAGRRLLGESRPADALRAFDAGLALWRGEPYASLADAPAVVPARARLAELRSVAVEERLAALLAVGDAPAAVGELDAAVRAEPYRERRWELLIIALYRSGRQADALAALRRVRARLADELGIDPGPSLQALEGRLLAQDPGLLLPAPPPALPAAPAPAASTPRLGRPLSHSLGRPLSHFLGREAELSRLGELIEEGRLVTLVGPGGAGKTRLAVEFAAEFRPWFARLADVGDPELVVQATADAAGVHGSTVEALAAALGDRPGLLVLDNCEHLVDAVAALVLALLPACPALRVLATSREPLGVDGERLLPVDSLPEADAVALLTDRITAIRPGWQPDKADSRRLARLATALDGIPLALELAAARARVLGLDELLDMLDSRFPAPGATAPGSAALSATTPGTTTLGAAALGSVPRGTLTPHQTLEAAIAWSVDLLSPRDRALLLRLWPFEGGFTMAAAGADLDALSSLVARSVVVADTTVSPSRYRLLEIVRAYCRSRDPDPAASRAAHAAWVRDLVERLAPELVGGRSAHVIRVLNRELANLRTGIVHDLAVTPAAALRTAGLLEWFWHRGGHVGDGLRLLRAALAAAPDAPPNDRARAWLGAGTLQFLAGDAALAEDHLRSGIEALGPAPDRAGLVLRGQAYYYESLLRSVRGDYERAVEHGRGSMAIGREIGERWLVATGAMATGWALAGAGDVAEGRRLLTEAIEMAAAVGQTWTAAMCHLLLGRSLLGPSAAAGPDPAAALESLRAAVRLFREEDDVSNALTGLLAGALALLQLGRTADGAALAAGVRSAAARRGLRLEPGDPVGVAALDAALAAAGRAAPEIGTPDDHAMMALLLDDSS